MPVLEFDLATLLQDVVSRGGSDLHLIQGIPPIARIAGEIGALPYPAMTTDSIMELVKPYLQEHHRQVFEADMRLNFSVTLSDVGRFRFRMYHSLGTRGATIRVIPTETYPLSTLGLPPIVGMLNRRRS